MSWLRELDGFEMCRAVHRRPRSGSESGEVLLAQRVTEDLWAREVGGIQPVAEIPV